MEHRSKAALLPQSVARSTALRGLLHSILQASCISLVEMCTGSWVGWEGLREI